MSDTDRHPHRKLLLVVTAVAALAVACGHDASHRSTGATSTSTSLGTPNAVVAGPRRNVVFVLADDLSSDLINERFTPQIVALARQGVSFDHYFVADSLCCPSRSTIFTGLFPHDTHVATNLPPDGGFQKFQAEGLDKKSYAMPLQQAGYHTAMLGKYLNGYGDPMDATTGPVPPGWTDWHVSNSTGYREFNFLQNDNGSIRTYSGRDNYGVDVLNAEAETFIKENKDHPFALEVATYAPHAPYTPAPRNAGDFAGLAAPRDASFDAQNVNPPSWLGQRAPLTEAQLANIDTYFRKRAQSVEAVDKLVGDVVATVRAEGLADRTDIVFSSDNGYHLGQHRLVRGKQTAFDTDIRVPLIIAGPGIDPGRTVSGVAQNVDLLPTLVELSGGKPSAAVEGRSLVPLLTDPSFPGPWRTAALVEHQQLTGGPKDPDFEGRSNDPTSYDAVRFSARHLPGFPGPVEALYVEYRDGRAGVEFYDVARDPFELRNVASDLTSAQRSELHRVLHDLTGCHGGSACWAAAQPG